jgi:hypothetical protein
MITAAILAILILLLACLVSPLRFAFTCVKRVEPCQSLARPQNAWVAVDSRILLDARHSTHALNILFYTTISLLTTILNKVREK